MLAYLQRLPVDVLKVDKSFVRDVDGDASKAAIVQSIVDLAAALNLDVVTEGVETLDEAVMLVHLGCDTAQGYYFSRPMAPAVLEATRWLDLRDRGQRPGTADVAAIVGHFSPTGPHRTGGEPLGMRRTAPPGITLGIGRRSSSFTRMRRLGCPSPPG